eukprot:6892157-Pyramimonas_sp.AAC.1
MGVGDACERWHWGLRWSSLWGHEACDGCADMGARDACGRWYWDIRWSPLRGQETCEAVSYTHLTLPTILLV